LRLLHSGIDIAKPVRVVGCVGWVFEKTLSQSRFI
jgi:hypothetical protein